jgi:hypothetical protein
MALPKREEFDLEAAADYLGCSVDDIFYYLDKGLLRLAVYTDHLCEVYAVLFADLPFYLQRTLVSLKNPDGIDLRQIKISGTPNIIQPIASPLYLTHSQINKIKDTEHELGEPIWIFQNLDGEEITIWTEKSPRAIWFYEAEGSIVGTYLAKEELDRIAGAASEEDSSAAEEDTAEWLPFSLTGERNNDIQRTMVEFGNRFYREKGLVPTADQLIAYLADNYSSTGFRIRSEEEKQQATGSSGKKDFEFSVEGLNRKSFDDRYNSYLNKSD